MDADNDEGLSADEKAWIHYYRAEDRIIAACYRTGDFLKYYIYPEVDESVETKSQYGTRRTKIYKRLEEDAYNKYGTTRVNTSGGIAVVNPPHVDDEIIQQLNQKTYIFTTTQHNNKKMEVDTERGAAVSSTDIDVANNKPSDICMANNESNNIDTTILNGKQSADDVQLDASTQHVRHQQAEERNDMQLVDRETNTATYASGDSDMRLTGGSSPTTLSIAPIPPPSTPKVQLIMLQTLLQHRKNQIQKLPQRYLLSFANDIISDLTKSRYEQNQYSEGEQRKGWSIDLAIGHYSELLLTGRVESSALAPNKISPDDIALHLLALAYRSMDDTLDSAMRKHGLDALQSSFTKLEYWLQKWESDKERKKMNLNNWKKRLSPDNDIVGEKKGVRGESLGDESASPDEKRLRKSPPETLQAMETDEPCDKGEKSPIKSPEEEKSPRNSSKESNDPMEIEPTAQDMLKSPNESNDKDKRLGEESSPEEGELKDIPKDSELPVSMNIDQPVGASIGRITLSPPEKNKTDNSAALDQTEVPKELLKSPPELGFLGKASGDTKKAPEDLQQQSLTGFVEVFTCDVCKKAFPTYAEADIHEKECMARKSQPQMLDTTGGSVTEKLNKSDNTEIEDPKERHDKLLEKYKNKKNFKGIELKKNSRRNNTVQAFHNATEYHRKFAITKVGDGSCPLTLVEAAYASDQAFVVEYCLHKARSNKSLELLFEYLTRMRTAIPELAAFGARQVYSKQFHEFAGSFAGRQSLNFFDLESLNKAWKKEVKKRSLDSTNNEISFERRKDIFVSVVEEITQKWKWTTQEMRVADIDEMKIRDALGLQDVSQQQQVPRINPTEEELSDVIVI